MPKSERASLSDVALAAGSSGQFLARGLSGAPVAAPTGSGTVLTPVPGGAPALTGPITGGLTPTVYRQLLSPQVLQTTDASYVEYDISAHAPVGATAALLDISALSAFAGSKIQIKAKSVGGPESTAGGGVNTDGSTHVLVQQAVYPVCQQVIVMLDADRKFLMKRTSFGDTYFGVNVSGWFGGRGISLGGPTVVVAGTATNYNAWPNAWVAPSSGTGLLVYVGNDELPALIAGESSNGMVGGPFVNAHATGGAIWFKRGDAAPVKVIDRTQTGTLPGGAPYNGLRLDFGFPYHNPSNPNQLIIFGNRLIETGYYITSADDGQTWSVPAPVPAFTNGAPAGHQIPFEFILSRDGTKIYGSFYDSISGAKSWLGESTNGINFAFRSYIAPGPPGYSGNETSVGYLPDGRMVAVIRNASQYDPLGTCYSDNDGLTWSAVATQTNAIHGHRGIIPLSGDQFAIPGRYVNLTGFSGLCSFVFNRNGTQLWRTAPYTIAGLGESAYPTRMGGYLYYYSDGNTPDGLGRPSIMRSVLENRP